MENLLYYLALLLCPIMIIGMFYFMSKMNHTNQTQKSDVHSLQQDIHQLTEQNQKLMKEVQSLKNK
ncbi:hypothetical protein ACJ2A9_02300 [Anaerobacillus sp. MEB173]|uniref:hypothetical protein n=1 Tax=Anaerobacillus sp. MEB173 TaxID=3383345 RepID=UPI003F8F759E